MTVKSYRDLIVWQKAMDYVVLVYRISAQFPKEEIYALTNQLRRASVSVPSNIAEGHGRGSTRDYLNFLAIARGSLNESETQLMVAERLGYVDERQMAEVLSLSGEVGRLLHRLCQALSS